jgi:Dolichyl-phosphate-mannose-protein mannosyltransferase
MRRILIIVFVVAAILRLGYGIVGYRHVLGASGSSFIAIWDHDALEHVLIAKAITEGKGYVVDSNVDLTDKHPRFVGGPALFKAPLYQYLLAGVFSLSGFSFALFFPLQVLLGSGLSVLVAKIAMEAFENSLPVGLYAGLAAAAHPVLVNTASQPYNENIFFFMFFLTVWVFFKWMRHLSWGAAIACGVLAGLTTLTRESMVAPFVVMVGYGIFNRWRERRVPAIGGGAIMLVAAVLTVAPWTLYNQHKYGVILPVSSISGTSLSHGNNECAIGPLSTAFDGEGGCTSLDVRRSPLVKQMESLPGAVASDRAYAVVAREFVLSHPLDYVRLCIRRAWTTFLPYHPRQNVGVGKKLVLVGYFVLVIVMGLAWVFLVARKGLTPYTKVLLLVAVASYLPLIAVYVSADLRYRVGIDLILACFAGYGYAFLVNKLTVQGRRVI